VILISLILAALTFNPAIAPHPSTVTEGYLDARPIQPDFSCAPGAICASAKFHTNGCYYNNFWNPGVKGGTPLSIDVTQTGSNGSVVYIYWINNTNKTLKITSVASLKYYCPFTS
jgi:hypothetical protein